MRKRIVSILLTLCMVLCLIPTAVFAEGSPDITGTGTAEDPYLIYTAAGLKEFQRRVNAAERDAHAKLVSDIVLNDGTFDEDGNYTKGESGKDAETWEPINNYHGTFDGNGKTIKGLYVNGEEYAGLFGGSPFAATVKNVAVTGYVSGKTAGGIAGEMLSGSISNCLNYCTVTGSDRAGGIVGSSDAMINSCGNRGSVSGSKVVGGIIGDLNSNTIANCYNTGTVSVSGSWMRVGGIVGSAGSGTGITNCYNAGSVSGSAGGSDIEQLLIGGIAGDSGYNTIANCYNVGQVSSADGTDCMGGIVGRQTKGTVNNCYYTTGVADNGIGYTEYSPTVTNTEAKSKSDFADGTVLNLLKNGDENSPWTKCGYLNAAGMTLPLLDWQTADAHTHNKNGDFGGCDCGQLPAGTADDPYLISNAEELKLFRDMVNGGNTGICAKLMNDIVLNDGTFDENGNYTKGTSGKDADMWMPINGYGGTFDGDGHTIQGVYVNYGGDAGLFSSASGATIKGLTITGYIKGKDRVGGIVGYMSSGTITGCRNAAVVRGEQSSYIACGGIAGRLTTGTIANCENVGSVQATPSGDGLEVGGIVGHAGSYDTSAIFEACANLGSVTAIVDDAGGYARVGGITGFVAQHVDLIDCYNAGSLLLTEQKGTPADSCLGGIFGCKFDGVYSSESELPSASNCYNVGTMTHTGNGKVAIGDIGGETPNIKIINCYGLTAQTKAAFADGTVLELLKGDRTDSPWTKTDYLKAAGMTLPLLSWQTADAHTHNYQWKYDNTEHWKECSCGFIEQGSKAAHKEVTGICTDGIQCACGYEMHTATGGHSYPADWTAVRPGSTHSKACTNPGCGVTKTESCTGGTATCTEQATCEVCGEKYGTTDLNNHSYEWQNENGRYWQKCKLCDFETDKKLVPTIVFTGSDKVCRFQDYTFSFTLPEGDKDAGCGYGFALMGGDVSLTVENGVYSGVVKSEWYDENENSFVLTVYAKTADGFEFSTKKTVAIQNEHSGGTATCTEQAACDVCHEKYGNKDPDNHTDITEWVQTETKHTQKYKCCGAIVVAEENHEWENGVCTKCGYGCRHTYEWQNENGQYWQKCKLCDFETDKKLVPTITITGSDKVCRSQDYTFSFTLPEGATDAGCGYGFSLMGGDVSLTVENGVYSGVVKSEWYDENENSFVLTVYAKTADGFEFSAKKTVAIQNEHSGGTATCTEQATCEICGEKYGDLKLHSYSADWVTDETNHWHECTECGAKTDEAEHTDTDKDHKCDVCEKVLSECADTNKDHKCDLCGKVLSEHTGGTATCKDKAVCEVCGESYGELDPNNHANLKHIDAKAATKTSEGNIEYWYCEGCDKYFADKDGAKEITKADTVTAKLPEEKPTSPKTGDTSNLALWIALLFISGGVITVTTVVSKKKRHS